MFQALSLAVSSVEIGLSGHFSQKQAKTKVVKIKILILPTGLEVHLEDMF